MDASYPLRHLFKSVTIRRVFGGLTLALIVLCSGTPASSAVGDTLSGTVSGAWGAFVPITLSGAGSASTTTDINGNYSFAGLSAGTYTVTPALAGYTFTPAAPQVTVGAGTNTQNFTSLSVISSFSISGNVSYTGTATGNVYVTVVNTNCNNCNGTGGTTLAGANGAYEVRGLSPGTYGITAEIDTFGTGQANDSNPAGSISGVTITSSNVTAPLISILNRTPPAPVTPGQLTVSPASATAIIQFKQPNDSSGINNGEFATSYKVYYDTNSNFTSGTSATFTAGNPQDVYFLTGLTNGASYYFKMSALNVNGESATTPVIGPLLIGAGTGGNTVSGIVTFTGITPTGPLYVGVYSQTTKAVYVESFGSASSPATSPVAFSISGVPNGTYGVFAIIDMNNDGKIDIGDITNVNNNNSSPPPIIVNSATCVSGICAGNNVTLTSYSAATFVTTNHNLFGASSSYGINVGAAGETKLPVSMTLFSGPNVAVPFDMDVSQKNNDNDFNPIFNSSMAPTVGDTYQFLVTFSDRSTQVLSAQVTAVLNSFAQNLTTNTPVAGSGTVPVFNWTAPASPPAYYTYGVNLNNTNGSSEFWSYYGSQNSNGIPSTQTNVVFDVDGSASPSASLTPGTTYNWVVSVQDVNQNSASTGVNYTVPAVTVGVVPPTITEAYGAGAIALNGSTTLTFTIHNSNTSSLTGVGFADTFPVASGLQVTTSTFTNTCGGTVSGVQAGATSMTLTGGTLAASGSCTVSISVTGTVARTVNFATGNVTSNEGGTGAPSNSASLQVLAPPTVTSFSPTSGPVGTAVTITGTNFGTTQAIVSGTVSINGTPAGTATSWGPTSITVNVPSGATNTPGPDIPVVTVLGVASNFTGSGNFTVTGLTGVSPTITSLSANSAPFGASITMTGTNFGSTQAAVSGTVTINGAAATVTNWSATSIVATVPTGATDSGNVVVTASGIASATSSATSFTVTENFSLSPFGPSTLLNAQPAALLFAARAVGTMSGSQMVTLNVTPGSTAAVISSITVSGDFAIVQPDNCVTTIAAGGSCSLSITYTPTATGPRTGQLVIASNDPASPFVVYLTGNSALQNLPGFFANIFPPNDDNSTALLPLGFTINFFGTNYSGLYLNNNGNVTFNAALGDFTPFSLATTNDVIIAPFFADVYTSDTLPGQFANLVTYGTDMVNGQAAFAATWTNAGYFTGDDKLNTFQVVLVNRPDVAAGDFDMELNYDKILWDTGSASGGTDGLAGTSGSPARAGYSNGTETAGTSFELPGSAVSGALLDSNTTTGLIHLNPGSSVPGRVVFQVRNGAVAAFSVALAPPTANATLGTQACVTATVTNSGTAVSGMAVTFTVTGFNPTTGSVMTGSSGTAQFCYTGTVAGTDTIAGSVTAGASGSATITWSSSAGLSPSATALTSSLNPSTVGQSVTFIAEVNGPAGGTPTGSVAFWDNGVGTGTPLGTGTISGGQATVTTLALSAGTNLVTAVYAGNGSFTSSTSNVFTQTVNSAASGPTSTAKPTYVALTNAPNPAAVGAAVLLTATVGSTTANAGTPTGSIAFVDNSTSPPTTLNTALLTNGVATFSTTTLTAGTHYITGQYFGDTNFSGSVSSVLPQTIGSGTPAVSVTITPFATNVALSTSSVTSTVTFTAIVGNDSTSSGVTWHLLSGAGTLVSTGNFTANYTAPINPSTQVVTVSATSVANSLVVTSIEFTLATNALSLPTGTTETPSTVTAGGSTTPLTVTLTGVPSSAGVSFALSCGNLPVGSKCVFTSIPATTPPTVITSVSAANPQFAVTVVTTGSSSSGYAAPLRIQPIRIPPIRPWYVLFAMALIALSMTGWRRQFLVDRKSYACVVLVLLCVSAVFLASCSGFSPPAASSTTSAPVTSAITPSGDYQVVVTASPGSNTGGFVQTQLIVPVTVH